MMPQPITLQDCAASADNRPRYHVSKLPEYETLNTGFLRGDFAAALPTQMRIVLDGHDKLSYDTSWMDRLYMAFYRHESAESASDYLRRSASLSWWVRDTYQPTFQEYVGRAITVQLIAELNDVCARCDRLMLMRGTPTYCQALRHIFGIEPWAM